jgi:hypothetical protein
MFLAKNIFLKNNFLKIILRRKSFYIKTNEILIISSRRGDAEISGSKKVMLDN